MRLCPEEFTLHLVIGETPCLCVRWALLQATGDFCHQVRRILAEGARATDSVGLSLDGDWCYDELKSTLDA